MFYFVFVEKTAPLLLDFYVFINRVLFHCIIFVGCSFGSLTALLYWTVGWEMGVVKRALEAARVNWGYFFDHNPFEPHCNTHPNNFILLPPVCFITLQPEIFEVE